ncbi:phosphoglycerol transferase MdoB-like AlkP superfamily enzyme [Pontibacter ummariensis]|uniref:Phosphoglycerol transferase MdoB n=1 Tax=Pontibacter ummariensis TaxID=1610492 RepID=A0A239JVL4_9BACT|nr:LTA synthase family protein [Pontibacter ummariensis]PRY07318.1 phosphoglycerol transferase MdoB-like AlkP superfamily enzyme [Pontibacter ummariensis]SNT09759.1 Phosphoglycerol transferase MdoB [Pontibacter ummariensis]
MFDQSFTLLLRRLGLLLALYMLLRIVFYLFNLSTFAEASPTTTLLAFVHGLRFDIAAVLIINGLFILLSLLPIGNTLAPTYQRILKWVFVLFNAPFLALALVDLEFFKFIGRRSSNELFTITDDIADQVGQLASYYWYLGLGFILLLLILVKFYPDVSPKKSTLPPVWLRCLRLLLVAGFVVLGIRGGLQLKPLRPNHAFVLQPSTLGHLTLNTPFTFIKGIGQTQLEEKHYFGTDEALLAALPFDPNRFVQPENPIQKENVVIIILESFSAEYVGALNEGKGYTPFLDSLASEGVLFRNAFANGRKSIEALPSILASVPSLMQDPFITSPFQANELYGLGTILEKAGYHTAMFHGAANGSMGFNNFASRAGIEEYYGLDEYPAALKSKDFDGQWGIFDEPYLQYVAHQLSELEQPFMATVFTLSSHQPYTVPAQYKGFFPKGDLEIHESIGYADYALKEFFKTASKQPWYDSTLFILTADHTQMSNVPAYQNELGHYRVPLLLFHPAKDISEIDPEQIAQHTDVLPTVVDYLNIPTDKVLPFGHSLLDSTDAAHALLYNGSSYFLVQQGKVAELTPDEQVRFYSFADMAPASPAPTAEQQLKAYVQYFRNGMSGNKLYFWLKR